MAVESERAAGTVGVVGVVGVGNIGAPLCRHLLAHGYTVRAYDVAPGALEKLADTAVVPVASLGALASGAGVILLSLPNSRIIEAVVLGDDGLIGALAPGTIVIDTSSSLPASTRRIAAALAERGVHMLDAPVSGGVARAVAGTLAVMVGGPEAIFARCRDLLATFGSTIFYLGDHGMGHLAKALNNLVSATTLAATCEAVLLGQRLGLDPAALVAVIDASSGRSNATDVKFPRYILNGRFDAGFSLALMSKDVSIAIETATDAGMTLPISDTASQTWQAALDAGYGGADHTAIYRYLAQAIEREASDTRASVPQAED